MNINRITAAVVLLVLCAAAHGADLLPTAPATVVELHGSFRGDRFWMRLNLPEKRFGGNRMLELVYTPPKPAAIADAHLVDCPFLLLDDNLRLVAWNGRDSMQRIVPSPTGYHVTRELERPIEDGKDVTPDADERDVTMSRGWDERVTPVLLVLAWHAGTSGELPIADFFGAPGAVSSVSWQDDQVLIAGRPHHVVADATGRLARLDDASGTAVLTVTAWKEQ